MDHEIVWTESAAADLEAIVRYLARRSRAAAESVRTAILSHVSCPYSVSLLCRIPSFHALRWVTIMEWRDEDEADRGGWLRRLHLSWPALLLAGWLLYEFTAQPGLASLVACAKFGWADVRTAFWLRRVDPDRLRGQTCFWSYLTYGLWKVAVMATVAMIAVGFLSSIFDRLPRQPQGKNGISPVLDGALAAAAMGFCLSLPTAYIAIWSAWRNGVRVWLGQAPRRARLERFWPPQHGGINAAPFVGLTILIMTVAGITLVSILGAIIWANAGGILVLFLGMLTALLIPSVLRSVSKRVIARSPQECWVAEENEEVYQIPTAEENMSGI
jgi:hypothetical protein